ncbi:MAG: hypothetical protein K8T89_25060 [Planctomycetes bacterium]|nr:hypothetical protein [Planctomycetota bacterium]
MKYPRRLYWPISTAEWAPLPENSEKTETINGHDVENIFEKSKRDKSGWIFSLDRFERKQILANVSFIDSIRVKRHD